MIPGGHCVTYMFPLPKRLKQIEELEMNQHVHVVGCVAELRYVYL